MSSRKASLGLVAVHACSDADASEWSSIDWAATESIAEEIAAERLAGWQQRYPDVPVHRDVVCDKPCQWPSRSIRWWPNKSPHPVR